MLALLLIGLYTTAYKTQPVWSEPATITVPDDYSTIQEAINAANPGDTVLARSNTYYQNVVANKTLILIGEAAETTLIDGNGTGQVVEIAASNVTISGFTVQNGDSGISAIGNIHGHNISNNIIANNTRGIHLVSSSNNIISQNIITNNTKGLLLSSSSHNHILDSLMDNNEYGFDIRGDELGHFLHMIETSNLVNGKPVYYLVNQTDFALNQTSHPETGYLGLVNCVNATVTNLTLRDNVQGLLLAYTNGSQISGNNITDNQYGVWLYSSSDNTLSGNNITSNDSGIQLSRSLRNLLSGNNITNNDDGIWLLSSSNNTLSENTIIDSRTGIYFSSSSDNRIFENTISEDNADITSIYGVDFLESSNNTMLGNDITGYSNGIYMYNSSDNTIFENNFTNNTIGLHLDHSSGNTVSKSSFVDNRFGVNLDGSSNNILYENTISANDFDGIDFFESPQNTVSRNNITSNYDGVWLFLSSNNTLSENSISANLHDGIVLDESPDNSFFHNNLAENAGQHVTVFSLEDTSFWDNGYPSGGNYWSDYSGVDALSGFYQNETGSDGIGDSPYIINTYNQDNYPLMTPYTPPPLHFLTILSEPLNVTFTIDEVYHQAPWSEAYPEGTLISVVMPETYDKYVWVHWLEDQDDNTTRIFILNEDTTLTALFTLDIDPPTITLLSPESRIYPVGTALQLTLQFDEPTSWIGYSLNDQLNVTVTGNTTLPSLSEGAHTLIVYANDTVGNIGHSDTVYFTIQLPENDTVPPIISVLTPENKTYTTPDSPLSFSVNEQATWIAYSLDSAANITVTGNTTLSDLLSGLHTLVMYATDSAGNTGASAIVHFTVAIPREEPLPSWIIPAVAAAFLAGAILLIYVLRLRRKATSASSL